MIYLEKNDEEVREVTAAELITKYRIEDGARYGRPGSLYVPGAAKLPKSVVEELRTRKEEILTELARQEEERRRQFEEAERRRREAHEAELAAIRAGEKPIRLRWHDGEYLSGYQVFGPATELLEELGLARYIEDWGWLVPDEVARALGEEFTYAAAMEFARPQLEAEAAKEAAKQAARQAKFDEAARTKKPIELHRWTTECDGSVCECSLDIVVEYAMPDGTVSVRRYHTH